MKAKILKECLGLITETRSQALSVNECYIIHYMISLKSVVNRAVK